MPVILVVPAFKSAIGAAVSIACPWSDLARVVAVPIAFELVAVRSVIGAAVSIACV